MKYLSKIVTPMKKESVKISTHQIQYQFETELGRKEVEMTIDQD